MTAVEAWLSTCFAAPLRVHSFGSPQQGRTTVCYPTETSVLSPGNDRKGASSAELESRRHRPISAESGPLAGVGDRNYRSGSGRLFSEEFVVLLPGADEDAAALRAEHLRAKVESIVVRYLEKNLPRITISIGVAAFPASGDSPQAVNPSADCSTGQPATTQRALVATVDIPKVGEVQAIDSLVDAAGG